MDEKINLETKKIYQFSEKWSVRDSALELQLFGGQIRILRAFLPIGTCLIEKRVTASAFMVYTRKAVLSKLKTR